MKRLIFAVVMFMFMQQARAQFQVQPMMQQNFAPNMCPYNMQPAQGGYAANDELDRLKRQQKSLKTKIKRNQKKISELDERIQEHRDAIDRRLQPELARLTSEHIEGEGNRSDFMRDCSDSGSPSAGSTSSDVPVDNADVAKANPNATAPSEISRDSLCNSDLGVVWGRNIQERGRVNKNICRERSPIATRPGSSGAVRACEAGIEDYVSDFEDRRKYEDGLRSLKKEMSELEDEIDYAKDDPQGYRSDRTEGSGCPDGNCGAPARSSNSLGSNLLSLVGPVLQAGVSYYNAKQYRKTYERVETYKSDQCSRLGYPYFMCNGPQYMAPQQNYFAHQQMPYPSVMPGYMGTYGGQYGGVPGGIGTGAFGCGMPGGMNGIGSPMTLPFMGMPGVGGQFGQPGYGAPGVLPYGQQYGAPFNQGFGPWGAPSVLPYQGYQQQIPSMPYGGAGGVTGYPPGVLPYNGTGFTPGSSMYNPLLLNGQLSTLQQQMGGYPGFNTGYGSAYGSAPAVLPYLGSGSLGGVPMQAYPSPVQPMPYGVGGSFQFTGGTPYGYGR